MIKIPTCCAFPCAASSSSTKSRSRALLAARWAASLAPRAVISVQIPTPTPAKLAKVPATVHAFIEILLGKILQLCQIQFHLSVGYIGCKPARIQNREVKARRADDTALATAWERGSPPLSGALGPLLINETQPPWRGPFRGASLSTADF